MVKISVVVVTRNRVDLLAKALLSLRDQVFPSDQYEVIVVDNNSSDGTRALVEELQAEMPNLLYVLEPELGVSTARNAGLACARGDYVAFIDDDAVAEEDWLVEIIRGFEEHLPKPGCVGGKVLPIWEAPQPEWGKSFLTSWSILDKGDEPVLVPEGKIVFGVNMSFQRSLLLEIGGFNRAIKYGGDETYVQRKLRRNGYSIVYWPTARVHHLVPKARVSAEYLCKRKFKSGRGEFYLQTADMREKGLATFMAKNIAGRPLQLCYLSAVLAVKKIAGERSSYIKAKTTLYRCAGVYCESVVQAIRLAAHALAVKTK